MKMLVCIKVVPRPEEVRVDEATMTLSRDRVRSMLNPSDVVALEAALALKERHPGSSVTLLSMGPPLAEPFMRAGLAMGADAAVLLSDRSFAGADTLATSYTLAQGVTQWCGGDPPDLILCGEESSDGATAQVPPGIAEWLRMSQVTYAVELEVRDGRTLRAKRELGPVHEWVEVSLPAVVSIAVGAVDPRFLDDDRLAWASREPITTWSRAELTVDPSCIGLAGSPTRVVGLKRVRSTDRKRERVEGSLHEQASALAEVIRAFRSNGG